MLCAVVLAMLADGLNLVRLTICVGGSSSAQRCVGIRGAKDTRVDLSTIGPPRQSSQVHRVPKRCPLDYGLIGQWRPVPNQCQNATIPGGQPLQRRHQGKTQQPENQNSAHSWQTCRCSSSVSSALCTDTIKQLFAKLKHFQRKCSPLTRAEYQKMLARRIHKKHRELRIRYSST